MEIKGKTVIVLGANGGIGSAVVKELERLGAQVISVTKDQLNLVNLEEVIEFSKNLAKTHPNISALINATGIGIYKKIDDITISDWETSLNINLTGPLFFIQGILPSMDKSDSVIINIGSGLGKKPYFKDRVPYIVSKFALRGMSLALNKDFEGKFPNYCLATLGSVMTTFGTGGMAKRRELAKKGKVYLTPEWVAGRLVNIIKDKDRQAEYTFYPKDYVKGLPR